MNAVRFSTAVVSCPVLAALVLVTDGSAHGSAAP
jgi:hypothetical protein